MITLTITDVNDLTARKARDAPGECAGGVYAAERTGGPTVTWVFWVIAYLVILAVIILFFKGATGGMR